ncbi:thiamine biosynthesis protein ThiS [Anaerobacillus sp. CMMVII]|uniref:thiamine biosynthesis protein ThiS n=1 Tax=Anaerobacillus sp. CMMVII TaxID=2755588 RepID=UPI0021B7AF6F|nr:thiamine biosynthesis protein ThiS [Anaerobacillus sp. CMMVII]
MIIVVNGEQTELDLDTVAEVVIHYHLDENLVVTEVDGAIIGVEDRPHTNFMRE